METLLQITVCFVELELYLKSSADKCYSNSKKVTEGMCHWKHGWVKYVANDTNHAGHVVYPSLFCNQHMFLP